MAKMINELAVKLMKSQPYVSELLLTLNLEEIDEPPVIGPDGQQHFNTTAYVSYADNKLCVNKSFMEFVVQKEKEGTENKNTALAVFLHEILHVVNSDHFYMFKILQNNKGLSDKEKKALHLRINIAMDIAVNQLLPYVKRVVLSESDLKNIKKGLPLTVKTSEEIKNSVFQFFPEYFGLPEGLTFVEYLNLLPEDPQQLMKMLNNVGGVQAKQHLVLDGKNSINARSISESMKEKLLKSFSKNVARGTVPGYIKKIVEMIEKEREIPWNLIFKKYISKALFRNRKMSWLKMDRRTRMFPGKKREKKKKVVIAVDTSGSTINMRQEFFTEINSIWGKTKCDIDIIECDAEVAPNMPYKYKGEKVKTMTGGGGTAFLPVFRWIKENYKKNPDVLVYLTDGYGEDPPKPHYVKYPVIWVTTKADPANWGTIIHLECNKR